MRLNKRTLRICLIASFFLILLGGSGLYFLNVRKTEDTLCKPINIFLSKNGENGIDINWETKGDCLGYVLYGESSYEIERVVINTGNLGESKKHEVSISGLLSTTTYYFIVVSDDDAYGRNGQPISILLEDIN